MLLRQPGSPGPSVLFFPSTAARTAVGIPGSAEEFPEDSGRPGSDLFAGEELRTYLERRLGGLHPDDAGEETKVIDVTGPVGECLPWSGLNLSRTADLDAVRRAEPFRRACFSSAPLIRSQPVTAVCSENKDSGSTGHGMVIGMASKKVTVTLDETQLDRIRALVAAGTAASVSGFVQHAVGVALDDVAGWGALLAEALRETGGALSDSERAWADEALGTGGRSAA
jgi:Arc/MetJ-type ribon-helix-helix transcriptional regulator